MPVPHSPPWLRFQSPLIEPAVRPADELEEQRRRVPVGRQFPISVADQTAAGSLWTLPMSRAGSLHAGRLAREVIDPGLSEPTRV